MIEQKFSVLKIIFYLLVLDIGIPIIEIVNGSSN